MAKAALIISTYNWPEALKLCLNSVKVQSVMPDEIIVADDGSKEKTGIIVQRFSETISVRVKHVWQEDFGFRLARIRNLAIKESECNYLIFIDGDVILHQDFIKDHLKKRKSGQFLTGSRVLLSKTETDRRLTTGKIEFRFPFYNAENKLNGIRNTYLSNMLSKYDFNIYNLRGCNMAFWMNDLVDVNGFDESYTGWGREDSDIAFRLMKNGILKYKLKFNALQFHLFHNEQDRSLISRNDNVLNDTITKKRVKAKIGLIELK